MPSDSDSSINKSSIIVKMYLSYKTYIFSDNLFFINKVIMTCQTLILTRD